LDGLLKETGLVVGGGEDGNKGWHGKLILFISWVSFRDWLTRLIVTYIWYESISRPEAFIENNTKGIYRGNGGIETCGSISGEKISI
jgi:hypothetical protein